MATLTVIAPDGIPLVKAGDAIAPMIVDSLRREEHGLIDGDVVVIAQKLVSKAEGRQIRLADVTPGPAALAMADRCGRDPRVVELILAESNAVLRAGSSAIIVEHRLGFVLANAGIDQSNIDQSEPSVLLLPRDPDRSAADIRSTLAAMTGASLAVVIIDSIGRAWRNGTIGTAIGVAGLPALLDLRQTPDLYGRPLMATDLGLGDEIAAAASLMMGQAGEGRPVAVVRGVPYAQREGTAQELVRPHTMDLFR